MTQPTVDVNELLHGGVRAVGTTHDRSMGETYTLAAKLLVTAEPTIDEYTPKSDPLLDEMLVNAARTAYERGLLEDESWVDSAAEEQN